AGFEHVLTRIGDVHPIWFLVAFFAETVAYLGYVLSWREVARVEEGPDVDHRHALAAVTAGFGAFVARGGFAVDVHAFKSAGVAGTAVYWFGDIVCLWACLHAFTHGAPDISIVLIGYATGYALSRRTLPLGGAGAVEALLPFALSWCGVSLAAAVVAVFAYRVFNLWLPTIPAALGLRKLRAAA